jgi:hypothetical protein
MGPWSALPERLPARWSSSQFSTGITDERSQPGIHHPTTAVIGPPGRPSTGVQTGKILSRGRVRTE